jgi:uncharacterized protein Yka (UPF0111/DUF47 family)
MNELEKHLESVWNEMERLDKVENMDGYEYRMRMEELEQEADRLQDELASEHEFLHP